jgi:hypothetical protein
MAANEKRTLKMSNNGLRNRDRVSEGNLPGPRKSRDVVAKPGNDGQEGSPRKSDGELVRRRRENQRAMRITDRSRDPNEHIDRLREDFPPIPPFPPQWAAKARRDRSLPLPPSPKLPRVDANQPFQRNRSEKRAEKQPTVDWDAMVRAKNEQIRLVAEAKSQEEENKRRAAEQKWKAAEQRRRAEEEHGTVDWRPLSKTENKKSEATCQCEPVNYGRRKQEVENSQSERQGEREEAEKRSKAEEAEKKARTVRVQRENEERRLRAFGPSGGSVQTERRPTWPPPPASDGTKPRGKELETRENKPINPTAAVSNVQDQRKQQQRPPARRNSVPARPKNEIIQGVSPKLAPLTAENLRAKAAIDDDDDDDDIDPLGRLLGDNMRTFIQGFALPTIYQSDITPSTEEGEAKDKNKKPDSKNKNKTKQRR